MFAYGGKFCSRTELVRMIAIAGMVMIRLETWNEARQPIVPLVFAPKRDVCRTKVRDVVNMKTGAPPESLYFGATT